MTLHILKIKTEYFDEIVIGRKTFELRKNDRNYQVGDLIHFVETNGKEFYGYYYGIERQHNRVYQITYVLKDVQEYGLDKDYCILGIKKLEIKE